MQKPQYASKRLERIKKQCSDKAFWDRVLRNDHCICFVLAIYYWQWLMPVLKNGLNTQWDSTRTNEIFNSDLLSIRNSFRVRDGGPVYFPRHHWDPIGLRTVQALCMLPQTLWVHMCISPVVCRKHCFFGCLLLLLVLTVFPPSLPQSSLSSRGRDLIERSHLELCNSTPLILSAHFQLVGFCICSHLLQEEASTFDDGLARHCMSGVECHQESFPCYIPLAEHQYLLTP